MKDLRTDQNTSTFVGEEIEWTIDGECSNTKRLNDVPLLLLSSSSSSSQHSTTKDMKNVQEIITLDSKCHKVSMERFGVGTGSSRTSRSTSALEDKDNKDKKRCSNSTTNCSTISSSYYRAGAVSVVAMFLVVVALVISMLVLNSTNKNGAVTSSATMEQQQKQQQHNNSNNDINSNNKKPSSSPIVSPLSVSVPVPVRKTTMEPTVVREAFQLNPSSSSSSSFNTTSTIPTNNPTISPYPTVLPTQYTRIISFLVLGDVPYNRNQEQKLEKQMDAIADDIDVAFVVHVGDLRENDGDHCQLGQFERVSEILRRSSKPVFVLPGDNDWIDCLDPDQGWNHYIQTFANFETRYWPNHRFTIEHLNERPETFTFIYQGVLFIGLNLMGEYPNNDDERTEWQQRHKDQLVWTLRLIENYVQQILPEDRSVGRIVIFGHANPTEYHNDFFHPLVDYMSNDLGDIIPMMYVNGDTHKWSYDEEFFDLDSFARITVTGLAKESPTLIEVHANGQLDNVSNAFLYNREYFD